jgi:hypothetical protein
MTTSDRSTVADPSNAWEEMEDDREICRALMGGTRRMREAGTKFLPREPGEDNDEYNARLERSFLFNGFKKTIKSLVGVAFNKPMEITTDHNVIMEDWRYNIDRKGRTLEEFSQQVLRNVLSEGVCYVWVDYPETAEGVSAAEERALDIRPYFVLIPAESVIYWDWQNWGPELVLAEIRIKEIELIPDGQYHKRAIDIIRQVLLVTNPDTGERQVEWIKYAKNEKDAWTVYDQGVIRIDKIPIVAAYGEQTGLFTADPPLMDLAWLNLEHWQSSSDQRNVLHIARVPFLFGRQLDPEEAGSEAGGADISISIRRMITARGEQADIRWVEHSGASIAAGREDLKDKEQQMASLGIRYLMGQLPGDPTATQRVLDKVEHDSEMRTVTRNVMSALSEAFWLMGLYMDEEIVVELSLDASFEIIIASAQDVPTLLALASYLDAPPDFVLEELKRWGFLSPNLDVEALIELSGMSSLGTEKEEGEGGGEPAPGGLNIDVNV